MRSSTCATELPSTCTNPVETCDPRRGGRTSPGWTSTFPSTTPSSSSSYASRVIFTTLPAR